MNRSAMAFNKERSKALVRKDGRERKPPPNQDYRGRSGRKPGERRPLERREAELHDARHREGKEGLQEHEHQRQRRFGGLLRVQREKMAIPPIVRLKVDDSRQKGTGAAERQGWACGEESSQLYIDGRRRSQRPRTE